VQVEPLGIHFNASPGRRDDRPPRAATLVGGGDTRLAPSGFGMVMGLSYVLYKI